MLFNQKGDFVFVKYNQDYESEEYSKDFDDQQAAFKLNVKSFFLQKIDSEPTFLSRFVRWCTGSQYMSPESFIIIEFNRSHFRGVERNLSQDFENMLPSVSTCAKTLIIPATAYDGDMARFGEKLKSAMDLSENEFDMK